MNRGLNRYPNRFWVSDFDVCGRVALLCRGRDAFVRQVEEPVIVPSFTVLAGSWKSARK